MDLSWMDLLCAGHIDFSLRSLDWFSLSCFQTHTRRLTASQLAGLSVVAINKGLFWISPSTFQVQRLAQNSVVICLPIFWWDFDFIVEHCANMQYVPHCAPALCFGGMYVGQWSCLFFYSHTPSDFISMTEFTTCFLIGSLNYMSVMPFLQLLNRNEKK